MDESIYRQQAEQSRPKWRFESFRCVGPNLADKLTEWTNEGWELVQVVWVGDGNGHRVIFKRLVK